MSSRRSVLNSAAFHAAPSPHGSVPRAPSSQVRATTGLSGGSARKALGSLHGAVGSAHVSSAGVGARNPSLYDPNNVRRSSAFRVRPAAGLNRSKR
jgi:hypothetical protein